MTSSNKEDERKLLEKHPLLDVEKQLYYHGIRPMKEIDVRKLKIISVAFVLLGLLAIYFFAFNAPVPLVKISDIYGNFLMNYATVFIEGVVNSVPYVEVSSGGRLQLRFTINDTTGEINVYVYDPLASQALKKNIVPFPGDHVKALVQIRVRETYTYAILQSLEFLDIRRNTSEPLNVTMLTPNLSFKYVQASGIATDIREVGSGILFNVDTGSGLVAVLWPKVLDYIYRDNSDYIYLKNNLTEGSKVVIKGVVYLYKGSSPEIIPRSINDIWIEPIIPVTVSLSDISNYLGKYVRVYGLMGRVNYESGSYSIELVNESMKATAMFSRNLFIKINPFEVGVGSQFEIIGSVVSTNYLSVIKYKVLKREPTPLINISDITEDIDGYMVAVKGTINGLTFTSSAVIFNIRDNTGSIKVFMPGSTYASLGSKSRLISENSSITLAGYVDVYRGELEIVVYTADGVQSIEYKPAGTGKPLPTPPSTATTPPPSTTTMTTTPTAIVLLNKLGDYVGSTVTVDVYLDGIQYDSDRRIYVLKVHDDSGEAYVLSSSTPVRTVIDPFTVGCGSELKITGEVKNDATYGLSIDIGSDPGNIVVVNPAPPPEVSIGDLRNMDLGVIIILRNVSVSSFRELSGGNWLFTAADQTGLINVFVPSSVAMNMPNEVRSTLESGGRVTIAGYLTEYGGQLEIVVYTSNGIEVVS